MRDIFGGRDWGSSSRPTEDIEEVEGLRVWSLVFLFRIEEVDLSAGSNRGDGSAEVCVLEASSPSDIEAHCP